MKKIVLFLITSLLFTVVLLSVQNTYSIFFKNIQTSLEVTTPKLEAVFLPGTEFNSKIKQIAGNSNATIETNNTNITSIVRSNVLTITPTSNNIVSTSNSSFPIYAWFSSGVLYYYTEVENPYMNPISDSMFKNILNVVYIDISSIDMSNVTSTTNMFNNCGVKELKTPKVYPSNTNVTIDLGKTMYDENNIVYTTLGKSTNPSSLTESWIKEGYVVSFNYNDSTNYGRGVDDTITNFTGAANYGGFGVRIDVAGFSVGDVLQLEFDYEGTNLTANSGSYMTFQSSGHISGWNHELGHRDYFYPIGNVPKTHKSWTVQLSQADIDEEYYGGGIRIDYYTGGSITFSNFKVSRITENSAIKMYDEQISEFPSPTKLGYTFNGWYTESIGGTQISSPIQVLTSDVTYYAHWTPNAYNLTINPNGGTYNGSASNKVVTQGMDSYYGLQTPVKEGYTFTGWTISGNGEVLRGNASGRPYSSNVVNTDTDGSQYFKYGYSDYVTTDGYAWPNYRYPFYNYTVGHTYRISFDTRINLFSGLHYITYRHASVGNDYHSGLIAVTLGGNYEGLGWQHFDMYRTFESSTHPSLGVEIAPNFEIYTEILPNSTASIDMDIKNIIITDMSTGEQLMPSEFNGYIYKYGVNGATLTANWVTTMTNNVKDYSYTGSSQEFIAPQTGTYKIEVWGANGGDATTEDVPGVTYTGGRGGYTSGNIRLNSQDSLIIQVGGAGTDSVWNVDLGEVAGGYNGGSGVYGQYNDFNHRSWGTGGGATDVRLVNGSWNDFDSLKSRIMVAAGGGGAYDQSGSGDHGGSAGGLSGYNGTNTQDPNVEWGSNGFGGTQNSPGYNYSRANSSLWPYSPDVYHYSTFGFASLGTVPAAGGGGGYYAGGNSGHVQSAAGGSSFISGYTGCNAINASSTSDNIIHTNQPNHYSGKVFTSGVMIDGKGCNWSTGSATNCGANQIQPDGSYAIGHTGNGYARITYLGN